VMAVLGQGGDIPAREVAARTAMDKVRVSRAVTGLVAAKRVQRQTDVTDGRVSRLSLTPRGRAIYDEIVPLALHLEELLLSTLSPDERGVLDRLMAKLNRQIDYLNAPLR
jgi:DNA-binding MarR family transcriptional regulator